MSSSSLFYKDKYVKHRLGKAWEKMRSWLRDETSRINQVVNRHARLQAVGVLVGDSRCPVNGACYDLTRAKPRETGSITRVEEFGLASVSKENLVHSPDTVTVPVTNTNAPPISLSTDTDNEQTRKPGPIKKRMLGSIRGLMASTLLLQTHEIEEGGQGGFEDVRRYVKQGGDFCKELASILHERAELEATYAKGLSKLSNKLTKACAKDQGGNGAGGVNEAWRCVGEEMEAAAEAHRIWGITLGEQLAKPLRVGVAEAQGRSRKSIENSVDKAGKSLHEWRNIATKSKKQSFACARENERLQDLARLQSISQSQQSNNKSSSHHVTEKEASKLEARRRKAEDSSRRADTEFYTVSVRAERARLEYESTMRKGAKQMELLEEERLSALKDLANVYLAHLQALAPRLQQSADRLAAPIRNCNVSQDVEILKNLIRRVESNDGCNAEQLLPDFYAEHVTLAMNRERRKQALVRVLHLIRQDLERERRGREGLETLHRAFVATPAFAADESTQNVTDKLHHMRSMLLYLEAARYKVGGTLAEMEGSKRGKHPLAEHILVSRDKQGLQQSVLKIPSWAKNESFEIQDAGDDDDMDARLAKDHDTESRHWADRTAGDGNSENPPDEDDFSDFDEFSSHSEDNNNHQDVDAADTAGKIDGTERCRAIYQYAANLNDELSLSPGDLITVHQKQADGWWIGECKGRTGIFPATYVQVIH
ncbi:nostrin isoform X2 [Xylocopa sonorina]|uniref:nostrin isoform X2 n=1 Tax=Xylocopa sonorina TaxID=1818115 RepID=UPI00403AE720